MNQRFLLALGNKIRQLRTSAGLSQEELAELSGLHRNHIGAVERGEKNPTISSLRKIAKALKAPLSQIFKDIA